LPQTIQDDIRISIEVYSRVQIFKFGSMALLEISFEKTSPSNLTDQY